MTRFERRIGTTVVAVRAATWWDFKLTPPLAMLWATALRADRSLLSSWRAALGLVGALAVCAAYVSLINDHYDRDDDARAGKANGLAATSRGAVAALVATCAAAGMLIVVAWRDDWRVVAAYLGSWIAFTLYSAPPARLKPRGSLGALADVGGAYLFPYLLAVSLATRDAGHASDPAWLVAVAVWAIGTGIRNVLWHQLDDLARDQLAGASTFAVRLGPERTRALSRYVGQPLSIAGLAAVMWLTGSVLLPAFLLVHLASFALRERIRGSHVDWPMVLDEYNDGLLPVALVLASASAHPADLWLLPVLLLLFRRTALPVTRAVRLVTMAAHRLRVSE